MFDPDQTGAYTLPAALLLGVLLHHALAEVRYRLWRREIRRLARRQERERSVSAEPEPEKERADGI